MKLVKLLTLVLLFAGASSYANMRHGGGPGFGGDEAFDLIVSTVDTDTATELTEARGAIDTLRDELQALYDSGDADQDAIDALRDELRTSRQSFRDQIREIVDGNEELRTELRTIAREAREEHLVTRYALRNDETFDEIVAAATTEQADTLVTNQLELEALRDQIRTAREAGATRDDVSDLVTELRSLMDEQRELVGSVLDSNDDLLTGVLEDARSAREAARDNARHHGFRSRRPGGS